MEQMLVLERKAHAATVSHSRRHIVSYDALHCVTQDRHVFLSANVAPARLVSRFVASR